MQIGKLVYVNFTFTVTAAGSGASNVGTSAPSGLPAPVRTTGLMGNRFGVGVQPLYARLTTSGAIDQFRNLSGSGTNLVTGADLADGATYQVGGVYEAA